MISFASDNYAPVHPDVLEMLGRVNQKHEAAYGNDSWTKKAERIFKGVFNDDELAIYFVFNGTAANSTSIFSILKPYESVLSAETAHIHMDECGAPERLSGNKIRTIKTNDGKLSPELLKPFLIRNGDEHYSQNKLVSISQTTEYGTVYTLKELKALSEFCHENDLYLHADGARISNAAVSLDLSFQEFTKDAGIDVLSFGGTKNGLMNSEAVIFFNKELAKDYKFYRKQSMQLASKMRYLSAQFIAFFEDDLWKKNAENANNMAIYFAEELQKLSKIKLVQNVEANAIFAKMPIAVTRAMQKEFHFYDWDEQNEEIRLMCSFDTKKEEVDLFINSLKGKL